MAEVGVLNLTIQDNSSRAAGGLRSLANALDRVKVSVGGLDLTPLSTQLASVRQAIANQKGASSTITKIAGLFNAINKYATGFGKANIDTQPIVNLATAVQAIDTGKLREFTQIVSDFGTGATDKGLNNMSSAMQNVASSMERISNAVPKNDIGSEFRDIVRRNRDGQKSSLMKLNLQQFASGFDEALDSSDSPRVIIQSRVSKQAKETLDEYTDSVEKAKNANQALEDSEERIARLREENAKYVSKSKDSLKESNYGQYRQFFMLKGKEYEQWRQAARDTYGFEDKIFKENETYADALKAVEEAAKVASPAVEEVGKKAADANAKAGELIEKVTVPARVDNIGDHVDQALTSANEKATQLVERLSSPVDAGSIGKNVSEVAQAVNEKTIDAFKIPALNEQSSITGPFQSAGQEIEHYRELLAGAKQELESWEQTYAKTQKAIKYNGATDERTNMLGHAEEGFYKAIEAIKEYESYITKLENHIRSFSSYKGIEAEFEKAIAGTMADTKFKFEPIDANKNSTQGMEQIGIAAQKTSEAFQRTSTNTKHLSSELIDLDKELKAKKGDFAGVEDGAKGLGERFREIMFGSGDLGKSMKNMFPTLSGLAKRFGNLIKYRMLRTVISHISKGFTEGVQNVYQYSKAVGTSLAPAMDSASSAFAMFKNSIGAAVAPLIQAFIPVINQVISVVITVINYLNQFFALLGGQATWTRALPQTTAAFDKQKKAAGGAGKAMKDLLADWDELNIIQSQSGGGGGGGGASAAKDYLNMFEEVNKFDSKVKDVVNFIKDNLDSILGMAKDIGLAILGWKVSSAFGGIIGALGSLIAAGTVIALEFRVSTMLNNKFFDTGDVGWLVADVLQALVGGVLMKKILGTVLKGKYAYLGIPIMLTVNAATRTIALLGRSDVSALSKEGLIANLVSALEIGGVAGYLAHTAGVSAGQAIGGGAAVALATFGVLTNLKTSVEAIENEEVTDDTIKGIALGSLALGLSATTLAKLTVPGVSMAQALGFGAVTGVGAGLVTIGATLGIVSTIKAIKSGITADSVIKAAIGSLSLALGAGIFTFMGTGSLGIALTAGGWAFLGTLAVIGATLGIAAIVKGSPESVKWGDESLTEEEIQQFVESKMFNVDVNTVANLVNTKVEAVDSEIESIRSQAQELLKDMNIVRLGLATEETLADMKLQLFGGDGNGGLIGDLKTYAKSQKSLIETSFTLVPIVTESGVVDEKATKEALAAGITGWSDVEKYVGDIGTRLGEALKTNAEGSLENFDEELVMKLTGELQEVQAAITGAQASSAMSGNILSGLAEMDQKSAAGTIQAFKDEQEKLKDTFNQVLTEELSSYNELAAFYRVRGNETKAKFYEDLARDLVANWGYRMSTAIKSASAPGRQLIADALLELVSLDSKTLDGRLHGIGNQNFLISNIIETMERNSKSDLAKGTEAGESLRNDLYNYLYEIINHTFTGDDLEAITYALDEGIIHFGQIFTSDAVDRIVDELAGGDETYKAILRDAITDLLTPAEPIETEIPVKSSVTETVEHAYEESPVSTTEEESPFAQAEQDLNGLAETTGQTVEYVNSLTLDDIQFDPSGAKQGAESAASAFEDMASRIRSAFDAINGLSFAFDTSASPFGGLLSVFFPALLAQPKASGGPIRSGDLIMANENGNIEMMGKMGNQPVVANNQQIVQGISSGVAQANGDVVGELRTLTGLMQRMLQKEFVAKAVPGSGWARMNDTSNAAYSNISGNA